MARHHAYYQPPAALPVFLRTDLTVYIQGIPWNLTNREARKLVRVIEALRNETPLPPSHQLPSPPDLTPSSSPLPIRSEIDL
jgi:hypothetical protein